MCDEALAIRPTEMIREKVSGFDVSYFNDDTNRPSNVDSPKIYIGESPPRKRKDPDSDITVSRSVDKFKQGKKTPPSRAQYWMYRLSPY